MDDKIGRIADGVLVCRVQTAISKVRQDSCSTIWSVFLGSLVGEKYLDAKLLEDVAYPGLLENQSQTLARVSQSFSSIRFLSTCRPLFHSALSPR